MHDATILRIHRFERDDLALVHGLFAEASSHRGERVFTTRSIPLGIDDHVPALSPRPVDHAVRKKLQSRERRSLLADDAARIVTLDLESNLLGRIFRLVFEQIYGAVHAHRGKRIDHEIERLIGAGASKDEVAKAVTSALGK